MLLALCALCPTHPTCAGAAAEQDSLRVSSRCCRCISKRVQVLLLDEITVDLDVLGRADLLAFLRDECEHRGATIIYVRSPLDACCLADCLQGGC